jgi:hypothetical protein
MKSIRKINEKNKISKNSTERNLVRPFILRFDILNATICSWCNQNVLGEGLNVLVSFKIEKGTMLKRTHMHIYLFQYRYMYGRNHKY